MKAVIYARYSSDSQREESIDGQLRECKEYADRHGLVIIGEYIDRLGAFLFYQSSGRVLAVAYQAVCSALN